ncbi:Copia protein [Sesamum angolense]|uniref:Copia protein n=1 Tax=Sesamum angolense TaxID=2727404 RepID=A0AAE1W0M9_9LAMI|nr:Copia protein [Sesamum angolense]
MVEPIEPKNVQTAQYRRLLDAYNKWLQQDMSALFTMLSCMHDNLIREYEKYPMAKELWEVLKVAYGSTSATRLRALTLTDEQQVLAVLRSLPKQTWGYVKLVLTHNEKINTFDRVASHLKLEADCRESERIQHAAFVAHASQHKPHKSKRWNKSTSVGLSNSQSQKQNLAHKDTSATKHVTRDRAGFINYHRVPACSYYIAMGNGAQEEIDTHKTRKDDKVSSRRPIGLSARSTFLLVNHVWKEKLAGFENQSEMNLKILRTDRGREYLSEQFHITIPYTPQQNGVAERRNRTLLKMARLIMAQANLQYPFGEMQF